MTDVRRQLATRRAFRSSSVPWLRRNRKDETIMTTKRTLIFFVGTALAMAVAVVGPVAATGSGALGGVATAVVAPGGNSDDIYLTLANGKKLQRLPLDAT